MLQNDPQLVRRTLSGDRAAFGLLYDRHARRVFHLLRRLTGSEADAEDLTQETFLAAYGSLAAWRGESALGTWLCSIAVRQYASSRRRSRWDTEPLTEEMDFPSFDADPLAHCTRAESQRRIEQAISDLPELCREVFVLVKVEGLAYREAAEWLHIPLGTVQSRLWRAVCLLQTALWDLREDAGCGASEPPTCAAPTPEPGG